MKNYKKTMKFHQTCNKMGLDWTNYQTYEIGKETLTIVESPNSNFYIFFNSNYDLIGIEKLELNYFSLDNLIEDFYERYSTFTDILSFGEEFGYPFEDFTLRNIVDIASCVEVIKTNHGHGIEYIVNGEQIDNSSMDSTHILGLSYIKFLSQEMNQYFINTYSLQVLGYNVPDIYSYLRNIINKVNKYIKDKLYFNERPYPSDIFSALGQDSDLYDNILLYDVINLIMAENGYRCVSGTTDKIEKIPTLEDSNTKLNLIMNQLKEIPNLRKIDQSYQKIMK